MSYQPWRVLDMMLQHVANQPGYDRRYAMGPGLLESRLCWRLDLL